MNLPNKLSLTRALLIPVMVVLMSFDSRLCMIAAAAVFGAAAYTDYLDGHIARQRGLVTDFGKFIDPVADKLLNLSAMVMLTRLGLLPQWVVIVVLARELCVDGLRMVAVGQGRVIAAGMLGKIKTTSQIVLVLWLLLTGTREREHPQRAGSRMGRGDHAVERRGLFHQEQGLRQKRSVTARWSGNCAP